MYSMTDIMQSVLNSYDQIASMYNDAYGENDLTDYEYLKVFIDNLQGLKVLDMGCGCGESAAYLYKHNLDVIGIDFSEKMLEEGRKLYPNLKLENQNILSTSFDNHTFHGITLSYVINHFNDEGLAQLKSEIDRLLVSNGLVFISLHEGCSEEFVPDPLDDSIKIYYHFMNVSKIDSIMDGYTRIDYQRRQSFGPEEFLCDKLFLCYRKNS